MKFDRGFTGAKFRPGKQRQAQIDGAGVQRVELVLESEAVPRRQCLTARQQFVKQRFVQRMRLLLVEPRQGTARDRAGAQMVKLGRLRREAGDDVAQAAAPGQLRQAQRHELRPARAPAQLLALVVAVRQGLEFMSRHQFQQLGEYRIMTSQGPEIPVLQCLLALALYQPRRFRAFLMSELWDSSDRPR